jgi:peptidoglycan hydrolase-like protein with peptidoglycan-binding domain
MLRLWLDSWRTLAAVLCLAGLHSALAAERIALVITNQSYPGFGNLEKAHQDGDNIAKALIEAGFAVTHRRDLDREGMLRAFAEYRNRLAGIESNAVGVLYYSGHGASSAKHGDNWLIPARARIGGPDDLKIEGVPLGGWLDELEELSAAINIVAIDACRNVAFPGTRGAVGFHSVPERSGMMIVFSTAPGELALDANIFSSALAKGIVTPNVPAHEVLRLVRRRVLAETGDRQMPWVQDGTAEDFYFLGTATRALRTSDIAPLQRMLQELVGEPSAVTGAMDEPTDKALRAFLERYGLAVPAVATSETLNYLRVAKLTQGMSPPVAANATERPAIDAEPSLSPLGPVPDLDPATLEKIRSLIAGLDSDDASRRRDVREELAALGPSVVAPLARFLRQGNPSSPGYYRQQLGAVVALTKMLRNNKSQRTGIVAQLEQQDIDRLVRASADEDRTLRIYASEFLFDLGDPRAVDAVVSTFDGVSDNGRYNLALVLKGAAPFVAKDDRARFVHSAKGLQRQGATKTNRLIDEAIVLAEAHR